jgi:chromosome partitioning protein
MKTVTFCSFKGGTAKTSTALNLGACLAKIHKKKVLFIDADSQANLSIGMGVGADQIDSLGSVLQKESKIKDVITQTSVKNLFIVPANTYLDGIEKTQPLVNDCYAHEVLRNTLVEVADQYDYCFIDTPPSFGWLTQSAIFASDYSVICSIPEAFSILALRRLKEFHDEVKRHHKIEALGVLLSQWSERGAINQELLNEVEESFPDKIFDTKIRQDKKVSRAVLAGVPVIDFAPNSRAADDYKELSYEFLKRIEKSTMRTSKKEVANV